LFLAVEVARPEHPDALQRDHREDQPTRGVVLVVDVPFTTIVAQPMTTAGPRKNSIRRQVSTLKATSIAREYLVGVAAAAAGSDVAILQERQSLTRSLGHLTGWHVTSMSQPLRRSLSRLAAS
jgi:hypothetical protein